MKTDTKVKYIAKCKDNKNKVKTTKQKSP